MFKKSSIEILEFPDYPKGIQAKWASLDDEEFQTKFDKYIEVLDRTMSQKPKKSKKIIG